MCHLNIPSKDTGSSAKIVRGNQYNGDWFVYKNVRILYGSVQKYNYIWYHNKQILLC